VRAEGLVAKDRGGTSDPYVELRLGKEKFKTQVIPKTLSPEWNEVFTCECHIAGSQLEVIVHDYDKGLLMSSSEFLGSVTIPLQFEHNGEEWYDLEWNSKFQKKKESVTGRILLDLQGLEERSGDGSAEGGGSTPRFKREASSYEVGTSKNVAAAQSHALDYTSSKEKQGTVCKTSEMHQNATADQLTSAISHGMESCQQSRLSAAPRLDRSMVAEQGSNNSQGASKVHDVRTPGMQQISIRVVRAEGLVAKDRGGTSDPYVELRLGKEKFKTQVIPKTLSPEWNEVFTCECHIAGSQLEVIVHDYDKGLLMSSSEFLGSVTIPLQFEHNGEEWYDLEWNSKFQKKKESVTGRILLDLQGLEDRSGDGREQQGTVRKTSEMHQNATADQLTSAKKSANGPPALRLPTMRRKPVGGSESSDSEAEDFACEPSRLSAAAPPESGPLAELRSNQAASEVDNVQTPSMYQVSIGVVRAERLAANDRGDASDPYVELRLGRERFKTQVKPKTLSPQWNETFTCECNIAVAQLEVIVRDYDKGLLMSSSGFLGSVTIPLQFVHNGEKWYDLEWDSKFQKKKAAVAGRILLDFRRSTATGGDNAGQLSAAEISLLWRRHDVSNAGVLSWEELCGLVAELYAMERPPNAPLSDKVLRRACVALGAPPGTVLKRHVFFSTISSFWARRSDILRPDDGDNFDVDCDWARPDTDWVDWAVVAKHNISVAVACSNTLSSNADDTQCAADLEIQRGSEHDNHNLRHALASKLPWKWATATGAPVAAVFSRMRIDDEREQLIEEREQLLEACRVGAEDLDKEALARLGRNYWRAHDQGAKLAFELIEAHRAAVLDIAALDRCETAVEHSEQGVCLFDVVKAETLHSDAERAANEARALRRKAATEEASLGKRLQVAHAAAERAQMLHQHVTAELQHQWGEVEMQDQNLQMRSSSGSSSGRDLASQLGFDAACRRRHAASQERKDARKALHKATSDADEAQHEVIIATAEEQKAEYEERRAMTEASVPNYISKLEAAEASHACAAARATAEVQRMRMAYTAESRACSGAMLEREKLGRELRDLRRLACSGARGDGSGY